MPSVVVAMCLICIAPNASIESQWNDQQVVVNKQTIANAQCQLKTIQILNVQHVTKR